MPVGSKGRNIPALHRVEALQVGRRTGPHRSRPQPKEKADHGSKELHHREWQVAGNPEHKAEMPQAPAHFLQFKPLLLTGVHGDYFLALSLRQRSMGRRKIIPVQSLV